VNPVYVATMVFAIPEHMVPDVVVVILDGMGRVVMSVMTAIKAKTATYAKLDTQANGANIAREDMMGRSAIFVLRDGVNGKTTRYFFHTSLVVMITAIFATNVRQIILGIIVDHVHGETTRPNAHFNETRQLSKERARLTIKTEVVRLNRCKCTPMIHGQTHLIIMTKILKCWNTRGSK
jgi:hypothetical protein